MGAVLQTAGVAELAAEVTCCACSSICGLAARDSATRAKFRYCSFLLLATFTCVIALIPGLRARLDKIPNLCNNKVFTSDTCDTFVGFSAVYRILFAMAGFHFILSMLTIKVTRVNSFRAKFNNSLWLFKLGLIFGLTIATFYIPKRTGFFRIWMYVSLTGGFMFVMFQIILVIDFGHSWSLSWVEKLESGNTKLWYCAMGIATFFMFAISFGAIISFYTYFTRPANIMKCHANFFYISFMSMQCIIATVISVTPSVQSQLPGAGLLQSSVVILYALYLTWNTLSSEPDSMCNPLGNIILEYDSFTGLSGEAIFGCLLTLTLIIFACTVRANTSHLGKYGLALAESEDFALAIYNEDQSKEKMEKELEDGNKEILLSGYVGYNYSFFHIIMSLASLHILMVLTNWHSPEEHSNMKTLVKNWVSVWVQMASSFSCILMYVWFLVTPLVKKVWGPVFGVELDEGIIVQKSYPTDLKSCTNKPRDMMQNHDKYGNNLQARKTEKLKTKQEKAFSGPESWQGPDPSTPLKTITGKNTYYPSDASYTNYQQQQQQQQLPTEMARKMSTYVSNESLNYQSYISHRQSVINKDRKTRKPQRMKLHCVDDYTTDETLSRHPFQNESDNQKQKQFARKHQKRFPRYDNTSIESINTWVSHSYRRKYQPLVKSNKQAHDQISAVTGDNVYDKMVPLGNDVFEEKKTQEYSEISRISTHINPKYNKRNSGLNALSIHQQPEDTTISPRKQTPLEATTKPRSMEFQNIISDEHDLSTSQRMLHIKNTTTNRNTLQNRIYTEKLNIDDTCSRADDSSDSAPNNARRKKKKKRKTPRHYYSNKHDSMLEKAKHFPYNDKPSYYDRNHSYCSNTTNNSPLKKFKRQNCGLSDKIQNRKEQEYTKRRPPIPASVRCNKSTRNSTISTASKKYKSSSTLYTKVKTQNLNTDPHDQTEEPTIPSPTKNSTDRVEIPPKTSRQNKYMPSNSFMTQQDISIVPSVFKRKPQDPDTADELLKLQWKILRTQAKIVKIQERIYRLQSKDEQDQSPIAKRHSDKLQTRNLNDTKQEKNYKRRRRKNTMS